jgi:hypothetical protein
MVKLVYIISGLIVLNFCSCHIFKKGEKLRNDKNTESKKFEALIDSLENNYLGFYTFSSSFIADYSDGRKNLMLKGALRIKKDTMIWMSLRPGLGIEIGRILFTRDSVKYIDRLKKEYFTDDYGFMRRTFGFHLRYEQLEAILINRYFSVDSVKQQDGRIIENDNDEQMVHITAGSEDELLPYTQKTTVDNYFWHIKSHTLKVKDTHVNFVYKNFKEINTCLFPTEINSQIKKFNDSLTFNLRYRNLNLNKEINMPFKISENYKRITLE